MTKAEKIQEMREKGYPELYIQTYAESLDEIERLDEYREKRKPLTHEETVLFIEKSKKENRERAIKQWKAFKYDGIWPFTSLDDSDFIKSSQENVYLAVYDYFKNEIGDEIDNL